MRSLTLGCGKMWVKMYVKEMSRYGNCAMRDYDSGKPHRCYSGYVGGVRGCDRCRRETMQALAECYGVDKGDVEFIPLNGGRIKFHVKSVGWYEVEEGKLRLENN